MLTNCLERIMRLHMLAVAVVIGVVTTWVPVLAADGGPQVLGCDYKFGQSEGTETCLIHGGGMNQGIIWIVFEIKKKRFRYYDSSPHRIELLHTSYKTIATYPVTNTKAHCRPGGRPADVYTFGNGDRVCIYWP
jgi:hypothetical protein